MRHSLFVILSAFPLFAWAQPPLTEAEALRLGLARAELGDLARATVELAEADVLSAGQRPNPTFGYSRDETRGTPGSVEHSLQIAQTFDVSGRRELHQEAATRRVEAAAAGNAVRRIQVAAEIRRRFYETLLKQEVVRVTETWAARFAGVEGIVQKLARAGEASGYDRRRIVREREATQARLAVESAELDHARERLAALTGVPGHSAGAVTGVLLPLPPPPIAAALGGLSERPDLRALSGRAEASDLEKRAAARTRIPDVTVGIGPKWVDNGITRENGFMVTLSVPLPVFDRGQAGQKRAAAEALNARAEHGLARNRAEGELRGRHRQLERLMAAAREYRARVVAATPDLLRIAESAYRGGESTILELLDAYRGALESETTVLDLEWRAREARIEYDLQTGSHAQ
jgi:cobalt-zinc-cadmium efflux system outer membrane protein